MSWCHNIDEQMSQNSDEQMSDEQVYHNRLETLSSSRREKVGLRNRHTRKTGSSKSNLADVFSIWFCPSARETRKRSMRNLSILETEVPPTVRWLHQPGPMATNWVYLDSYDDSVSTNTHSSNLSSLNLDSAYPQGLCLFKEVFNFCSNLFTTYPFLTIPFYILFSKGKTGIMLHKIKYWSEYIVFIGPRYPWSDLCVRGCLSVRPSVSEWVRHLVET